MKFGPKLNASSDLSQFSPKDTEIFGLSKNLHWSLENSYKVPVEIRQMACREFIKKLKMATFPKRIPISHKLEDLMRMMGDNSYFLEEKSVTCLFELKENILKIFSKLMISPNNTFRILWDIFLLLLMVIGFFYIPYQISFDPTNQFEGKTTKYFSVFFFLDIILNFTTGEYIDGLLVKDPAKIWPHYLKNLFIFDLVAFIRPFFQFLEDSNQIYPVDLKIKVYQFFFIAKIPRFFVYSRIIANHFKFELRYQNLCEICRLLFYSSFVAHNFACLWHLFSKINPDKNWLIFYKIQHEEPLVQYLYSLYWTLVTLMTVGYGDITPQNQYEVTFVIFTLIFGCGLYAFNLNSIGLILQNLQKKNDQLRSELRIITDFMERKNIDSKLQTKIQEYLHFLWSEQNPQNTEDESRIIKRLNDTLKEELLLQSYGGIFKRPIFLNNFSEITLRRLLHVVKEVKLMPGEVIFEEGDIDSPSLFFIAKGSVDFFLGQSRDVSLKIMKHGEIFGEISFFTGAPRTLSCRSKEFTSVLVLNRNSAIKVLKGDDADYENFCMLKDKILQRDFSVMTQKCFYCRSSLHSFTDCPFLHFVPDLEKIMKENEFHTDVPRRKFQRNSIWKRRFPPRQIREDHQCFLKREKKQRISSTILPKAEELPSFSKSNSDNSLEISENDHFENESLNSIKKERDGEREASILPQEKEEKKEDKIFESLEENSPRSNPIIRLSTENYEFPSKQAHIASMPIPQQPKSYFTLPFKSTGPTLKETKGTTFVVTTTLTEKDKKTEDFERIKIYRNYFPRNNFPEVVNQLQKLQGIRRYMRKLRQSNVLQINEEKELCDRVRSLKQYSFYWGKFMRMGYQRFHRKHIKNDGKEPVSSINSPKKSLKFSDMTSFFDRSKGFVEKSFTSIFDQFLGKILGKGNLGKNFKKLKVGKKKKKQKK